MINKTDLRIRAKSIRKTLDIVSLSSAAVNAVKNLELYKSAQNVMIFYPMKYEINLLELLNSDKNFYLPKVNGENMFVCPFSKDCRLEKSKFNVQEPCTNPVNAKIIDIAIVPALMADAENYRLGYGGGFYDRFLAANPNIKTIVPIARELFVDKLPVDDFDVKVDKVLVI